MTKKYRAWQERALEWFERAAESESRVYTRQGLGNVLSAHASAFESPRTLTQERFIQFLIADGQLREVKLESEPVAHEGRSYAPYTRYAWGDASAYEMALSLKGRSYLSHAAAAFLHGLTPTPPGTIYANKEQSPKPPPRGPLTQEGIDRAFSRRARESNLVYTFEGVRIVLLSGKHSADLGVAEINDPNGIPLPTTGLERTLVDIVVRPSYAGGAAGILRAYTAARERVSVRALVGTLERLGHMYPFHQAIGFCMHRAGYPNEAVDRLRELGCSYDFYLEHAGSDLRYDAEWRIYYPASLAE